MPMIIGIKDIIDILLVALLLYGTFRIMKDSGALSIFVGVLAFVALWVLVTYVFEMKLMGAIMDKFISVGAIALIVLFQNEIRRFLVMLGSRKKWKSISPFLFRKKIVKEDSEHWVMQIVLACQELSKKKIGALIVIEKKIRLDEFIKTGEDIDSNISSQLIQNIFFKNSPLHDGAMIISDERIKAVSCILPVSHDENLPKELGLRHRAALGVSQVSDCMAIVVSEETGIISVACFGEINRRLTIEDLERFLSGKKLGNN
jgi:uncharacterized protein (TIGR00159 family)